MSYLHGEAFCQVRAIAIRHTVLKRCKSSTQTVFFGINQSGLEWQFPWRNRETIGPSTPCRISKHIGLSPVSSANAYCTSLNETVILEYLSSSSLSSLVFVDCLQLLSGAELGFALQMAPISSNQSNSTTSFRNASSEIFPLVSNRSSVGSGIPVLFQKDCVCSVPYQVFVCVRSRLVFQPNALILSKISKLYSHIILCDI